MIIAMAGFDAAAPNQTGDNYWDGGTCGRDTGTKRTGTASADIGGGELAKTFAAHPVTIGVAWACYCTALNQRILRLTDGTTDHISITVDTDGTLRVRRGNGSGTILGSSAAGLIPTNAWFHLEIKVLISDTVGTVEVRFNGVTKIGPLTSQDTASSANIYVGYVGFLASKVDDVVIWDTSRALNNNFLGDVKVETIFPDSAGSTTQFTPSSGSNYQNVDENPPNDDTDYNEDATVNDIDLYNLGALTTTSGAIKAVQVIGRMRKTDAGAREAAVIQKSSATTTVGTTQALGTSFVTYRELNETNPATAAAYTISEVNALQAGLKVIS